MPGSAAGSTALYDNGYAMDANLDYRFRHHDDSGVRNDSDLRWRLAGSRTLGDDNWAAGFRGRVNYRGNGDYRNDYSIFTNYRHQLDDDQLSFGAEVRRRRYPEGPLRARSRTTADVNVGWTHVINDQSTFSMTGHGGRNGTQTSRPDGDSSIYGAIVDLDYAFSGNLGWYIFGWWERDNFNTDAYPSIPTKTTPSSSGARTTCTSSARAWCGRSGRPGRSGRKSSTSATRATSTTSITARRNTGSMCARASSPRIPPVSEHAPVLRHS